MYSTYCTYCSPVYTAQTNLTWISFCQVNTDKMGSTRVKSNPPPGQRWVQPGSNPG